jgi:hypothetical protein
MNNWYEWEFTSPVVADMVFLSYSAQNGTSVNGTAKQRCGLRKQRTITGNSASFCWWTGCQTRTGLRGDGTDLDAMGISHQLSVSKRFAVTQDLTGGRVVNARRA